MIKTKETLNDFGIAPDVHAISYKVTLEKPGDWPTLLEWKALDTKGDEVFVADEGISRAIENGLLNRISLHFEQDQIGAFNGY